MKVIESFAVSCNLMLFCGLIGLLFIMLANPLFDRKQNKLFVISICVNLVALLAISFDYTISVSGVPEAYFCRRITSFLNFALSPFIPFLLYQIFQKGNVKKWLYAPLLLNFIVSFLSMWFKLIFEVSEKNTYGRGPIFYLPVLTSIFYILALIIKPASRHAQKQKKERVFLFGVIGLIVLSMFLEIQFGYFFFSWNASALCVILYYLLLNIHYFSLDTLTGIPNRFMYNHTLSAIRGQQSCIIAMIDINNFKEINDVHGHAAGDECLIKFSKILSHEFLKTASLFRIGGDEFILISKTANTDKFEQCIENAKEAARLADISFAYGMAVYTPSENLDDVLALVDKAMYSNKALNKISNA